MTMRTVATLSSIELVPFLRNRNFQPRTVAGTRLDHQIATNSPNPFLDHCRAAMKIVQFGERQSAGERKSMSIIVNHQLPQAVLRSKSHVDRRGTAVLPDVNQALLHDPGQFPAGRSRQSNFL